MQSRDKLEQSRECQWITTNLSTNSNLIGISCKGIVLAPSGSVRHDIPGNGRGRTTETRPAEIISLPAVTCAVLTVRPRLFIQQLVLAG